MKKTTLIILLAGLASFLAAKAQTNVGTGAQPAETKVVAPATQVSAAPAAPTAVVMEAPPAPLPIAATNDIAAVPATNAATLTAATPSGTNLAATSGPMIPLIHFSDVPITTAIESLARQAGINYMLDPKIS